MKAWEEPARHKSWLLGADVRPKSRMGGRVGQIQRVRDRWRDEQTGSLQKSEKRTESQLGRRQKMRHTGGRQIKAGSGQRGKDRRE